MDKIWDRKSFEVGGHWPLWRDEKNRLMDAEPTKKTLLYETSCMNINRYVKCF